MKIYRIFKILEILSGTEYKYFTTPAHRFLIDTVKKAVESSIKVNHRDWYESSLQREVTQLLHKMTAGVCTEHLLDKFLLVDTFIPPDKVIEIQGPIHFYDRTIPTGPTALKKDLLEALGYKVGYVTHFDWESVQDRQLLLERVISSLT